MFKKILFTLIFVVLLLSVGLFSYFRYQISHPAGNFQQERFLEVLSGQGTMEIAQNLHEKGFIKSPWVFSYYVLKNDFSLKPGIYYLKDNLTIPQLVDPLSKGLIKENKVTIIEGWRLTEIADYLYKNGVINNKDKFLKTAETKEGYLFPDTYRFSVNISSQEIIQKMEDNFKERTKDLNVSNEAVILASIIEREAKNDDERAKIAGVYTNRLKIGMKLEADPTISYAKGNWNAPTIADLQLVDSPYNTYKYKGLPPGPIANPGLASIKAALNPQQHNYYYFFHSKNGQMIMSKTLDEHNANRSKYQN